MRFIKIVLLIALLPLWLPMWFPFWVLKKTWRILLTLLFFGMVSGCASSSNHFEKSPCACQFQQINTGNFGGKNA